MGRINFSRVVLGGVLAGILINISEYLRYDVVLRGEFEEGLQRPRKRPPERRRGHDGLDALGIRARDRGRLALRRDPAALRAGGRHGGPRRRGGLVLHVSARDHRDAGRWDSSPISPVALVWTLVECVAATLAGAWLYRESEP